MADIAEYILNLSGNLDEKLKSIGINNDKQLGTWAKVQTAVVSANKTMNDMGKSIGSMNERIAALKAQKEWIPASNKEAIRQSNLEIKKLSSEVEKLESLNGGRLKKWFEDLKTSVPAVRMLANPLTFAAYGVYKLNQFVGQSKQVYEQQSIAQTQLAAVMRNTIGASSEEFESIKRLTDAQQKLGIISSSVQMAGAKELATYVSKAESLEKLMPAMNDMLAQQYGLNASQEQAAQIASMMGKVMDGQVGALSRAGYKFDEAQEKILKTGTEAQRAAVLFDVVTTSVGGVNEALANTPEGKLKQQANNMADLQARVGSLVTVVQAALSPIIAKIGEFMDIIISFFEKNREKITKIMGIISKVVTYSFERLWKTIKFVWNIFSGLINFIIDSLPVIGVLAAAVAAYNLVIHWAAIKTAAFAIITKGITLATTIWTGAQWLLNAALTMNPIGLVIATIIALIAVIGYVAYKTDGWGKQWESIVNFMKYTFMAYVESVKLYFSTLVNGIMMGIDKIKLGWYKFKEAVGMGDSEENKAFINQLNQDIEDRKNAIVGGAEKVAEYAQKAKDSLKWELSWNSERSLGDMVGGLKAKLGIGTNDQLQNMVGGGNDATKLGDGKATNDAIATGGTRNSTVNIKFNDMVGSMIFQGDFSEKKGEFEREVTAIFARMLRMAETQLA
ncbi:MAG: hypothetical protein LBJ04_24450 [Sphingobacterium sp.]|jgi:hypothetical protein|nr:hypothetical protein [Sphingobacterium sp.]